MFLTLPKKCVLTVLLFLAFSAKYSLIFFLALPKQGSSYSILAKSEARVLKKSVFIKRSVYIIVLIKEGAGMYQVPRFAKNTVNRLPSDLHRVFHLTWCGGGSRAAIAELRFSTYSPTTLCRGANILIPCTSDCSCCTWLIYRLTAIKNRKMHVIANRVLKKTKKERNKHNLNSIHVFF